MMNNYSITCPECKNSILFGEKKCPHCGAKKHKGLIICESCNGQFYKDAKSCPHCGSSKHRNALKRHPILSILLICLALTFFLDLGDGKSKSTPIPSGPSKSQLINSIDFQYETYKGKYKENSGISINPKLYNKSNWNVRVLGITCKSIISGVEYEKTANIFLPLEPKTPDEWENLSMDDLPIPKKKGDSYNCKISDAETF